jgi:hypothetical protein
MFRHFILAVVIASPMLAGCSGGGSPATPITQAVAVATSAPTVCHVYIDPSGQNPTVNKVTFCGSPPPSYILWTPAPSATPIPKQSATATPTLNPTVSPTATPIVAPTPTPTPVPSTTPAPIITLAPTPVPIASPTQLSTPTPAPTATPVNTILQGTWQLYAYTSPTQIEFIPLQSLPYLTLSDAENSVALNTPYNAGIIMHLNPVGNIIETQTTCLYGLPTGIIQNNPGLNWYYSFGAPNSSASLSDTVNVLMSANLSEILSAGPPIVVFPCQFTLMDTGNGTSATIHYGAGGLSVLSVLYVEKSGGYTWPSMPAFNGQP